MDVLTRETSTGFPPCSNRSMTPAARRRLLLREIAVVLDVGANEGQYGSWVRSVLSFPGRIISFEPSNRTFNTLACAASGDTKWECQKWLFALRGRSCVKSCGR